MACKSGKCDKTKCIGGCGFLNSYDWFNNMLPPGLAEADNIYEVRIRKTKKNFFENTYALNIKPGDWVVVENVGRDGKYHEDIGEVTLGGVAAIIQLNNRYKNKGNFPEKFLKILRKATDEDLERLKKLREKESEIFFKTKKIIKEHCPSMKLSEVEYVADGKKMYFHFTSPERVDFSNLVKILAKEFRVRVEMNQINERTEAALIGGYGSCGRPLCCSTFLHTFKNVELDSTKFQNVVNSQKISGLCGRLKCCFNYELDIYLEIYKQIPDIKEIETETGKYKRKKIEVLKKRVWYSLEGETYKNITLSIEQLKNIQEKIEKGETIKALEEEFAGTQEVLASISTEDEPLLDAEIAFVDGVGNNLKEDLLTRKKNTRKKKNRGKRKSKKVGQPKQQRSKNKNSGKKRRRK